MCLDFCVFSPFFCIFAAVPASLVAALAFSSGDTRKLNLSSSATGPTRTFSSEGATGENTAVYCSVADCRCSQRDVIHVCHVFLDSRHFEHEPGRTSQANSFNKLSHGKLKHQKKTPCALQINDNSQDSQSDRSTNTRL